MTAGDGLELPAELAAIENDSRHNGRPAGEAIPTATPIALPHRPDLLPGLWMGGTHSALGNAVAPEELAAAIVVDCAGELPEPYRRRAAAYLPCVFTDLEARPARWDELVALVHNVAAQVRQVERERAVQRVFVFCNAGMNRSGLVTALLLRALGEDAETSIACIRAARPGALSNATFVSLIHAWPES